MPTIIPITDFAAPELDIYARLTENQLLNRADPANALFVAESPLVIGRDVYKRQVYGAVPSPARSGGRNFGRGLSSGTGGIFRETPSGKAVDAKFLRNAERFKTFVTTPAGLLNNSPVS